MGTVLLQPKNFLEFLNKATKRCNLYIIYQIKEAYI